MINENRVTRYLTYAVGEIILVVIGILLALQLNNWNTERNWFRRSLQFSPGCARTSRWT